MSPNLKNSRKKYESVASFAKAFFGKLIYTNIRKDIGNINAKYFIVLINYF